LYKNLNYFRSDTILLHYRLCYFLTFNLSKNLSCFLNQNLNLTQKISPISCNGSAKVITFYLSATFIDFFLIFFFNQSFISKISTLALQRNKIISKTCDLSRQNGHK